MKKNDIKDLPETTNHVNGWPVIRQYLTSSRITQTALAAHLRITPSAITQIKQGLFLLNAAQLRKTADFLKMDEKGITAFYTQIFRGRLLAGDAPELQNFSLAVTAPAEKNAMSGGVPAETLEAYEPLKESTAAFLARQGIADVAILRVRYDGNEFLLRFHDRPAPGETVLLKCRGKSCKLAVFRGWDGTGGVFSPIPPGTAEEHLPFAGIVWLYPAEETPFTA